MKIKTVSILKLILLFIAVSLSKFFFVGISFSRTYNIYFAVVAFAYAYFLCKKEMRRVIADRFIMNYTLLVLACLILLLVYTSFVFPSQTRTLSLDAGYQYFIVLCAIPILCCFVHDNSESAAFSLLNVFATIWYLIVLAQAISYPRIILPHYFGDYSLQSGMFYRNNSLRMDLQVFGNLMIVYNFYKVYNKKAETKHKIFNWGLLLLGIYELIVIQQTRMYVVCIALCLLAIVILDESKTTRGFSKKLLVLFLVIVAITQTTYVSNLLQSVFSTSSELKASTNARLYTWGYYWDYFRNHPWFGFGFASDRVYSGVVHGSLGTAYLDDVGFVGQLARLGICIVPIILWLMIRIIKVLKEIKRSFPNHIYVLYFSLFVYILTTSFTLIMFDPQRILLYPLVVALFEFKHIQIQDYNSWK